MLVPAAPVYWVEGIRSIENKAIPKARPSLMARAGRAAATEAVRLLMDRPGPVLIVCGPGNNGGDGFVMARHLLMAGRPVMVAFCEDPARLPEEARHAHAAWRQAGGETTSDLPSAPAGGWALIVDALFGIGLKRPLEGRYARWIETLNALPSLRLAMDVPSGLDADTGAVLGMAFRATHTVTFIALKTGLLTLDGPDHAGEVSVQRLELDPPALERPAGLTVQNSLFRSALRARLRNTHKGHYGDVAIVGGSESMVGAALLAGRAALHLGAGRVFVGLLDPGGLPCDPMQPELMFRPPYRLLSPEQPVTVMALGPGLGESDIAFDLLERALKSPLPLVLDADALNILSNSPTLWPLIASRTAQNVLTPHPAEAARLLGQTRDQVQENRVCSAQTLAARYNALVVLKGCGSVIATPKGEWFINSSGHPGMASGGMGDVLTGFISALMAQGWPALEAVLACVHLHGKAAERLEAEGEGPIGLVASEMYRAARALFNEWIGKAHPPLVGRREKNRMETPS
jgi:ADP-dependent NAD(P)H-hydrate dehydratase / NAD(P)H-hydrate epimerase